MEVQVDIERVLRVTRRQLAEANQRAAEAEALAQQLLDRLETTERISAAYAGKPADPPKTTED